MPVYRTPANELYIEINHRVENTYWLPQTSRSVKINIHSYRDKTGLKLQYTKEINTRIALCVL